jgi:hypothetical protein
MWTAKRIVYFIVVTLCFFVDNFIFISAFLLTGSTTSANRITNTNNYFHHNDIIATTKSYSSSSSSSSSLSLSTIEDIWESLKENLAIEGNNGKNKDNKPSSPGVGFLNAINEKNIDKAMTYIIDDSSNNNEEEEEDLLQFEFEFEDTDFPNAWYHRNDLERNLRLRSEIVTENNNPVIIVVDEEIYDAKTGKSGVAFHLEKEEQQQGQKTYNKKGAAFFELNDHGLIYKAFIVKENDKSGESSLKILKIASEIISVVSSSSSKNNMPTTDENTKINTMNTITSSSSLSLPEQYFIGWNDRDMTRAVSVFGQDVQYDDTAFPEPFSGKAALEKHLFLCAESMPPSFSFVVDDKIDNGNKIMVRWHVENNSEELPYTRGCSWYLIENGKIVSGTDLKEPAVFKTGGITLFMESFLSKLKEEPIRFIPVAVWGLYVYVVFFSSWFYGLPAQSMELRTWEEVRDLSINFFLVSPILDLPFSPVVHPGLEGIFNLLLSWAALFAGFLSDDRKRKPNLLPMLPTVIGMQFLTSAFLLPYLATRSTEGEMTEKITREELSSVTQLAESRILGAAMGIVGTGSILWGAFARTEDYGDLATRYSSLLDLLSIDRVGSSFLVDLAIFGLFQGWLVDDDAKRRGMESNSSLTKGAKYIPFFGLVAYLTFRSELLVIEDEQ